VSKKLKVSKITKYIEELDKKIRRFFISNSIGSQYKLITIKEKAEFSHLEITTNDSSSKQPKNPQRDSSKKGNIKIIDSHQLLTSEISNPCESMSKLVSSMSSNKHNTAKAYSLPLTPREHENEK
jgi:hypothetical protein